MKCLKSQSLLGLGVLLWCLACADVAGSSVVVPDNIFRWGAGTEQPIAGHPHNRDHDSQAEFLPYGKAFRLEAGEMVFRVPEGDAPERYRYTGLGPFKAKPGYRYTLKFQTVHSPAKAMVMFAVTSFKNGVPVGYRGVYNILPRNRIMTVPLEQDFASSPEADALVLWVGISDAKNRVAAGETIVFKNLEILERAPLSGMSAQARGWVGKNLLPIADFETEPLGVYQPGSDVFNAGSGAHKNLAEIIKDETKCLRIVKKAGGYIYPHFTTPALPLDGCWVEQRFRIKGRGTVAPGIWWREAGKDWDYQNGPRLQLTEKWQEVVYRQFCVSSAGELKAAAALCLFSREADVLIDDYTFKILPPEMAK